MKKLFLAILLILLVIKVKAQTILELPKNDSADLPTMVGLSWIHQANIVSYSLEVDTSNTFSSPLLITQMSYTNATTIPIGSSLSDTVSDLNYGEDYYWRLKMYDVNMIDSSYSEIFRFQTFEKTALIGPVDGATNVSLYGDMFFKSRKGAVVYRYQVSTTNVFTSPIYDNYIGGGYVFQENVNFSVHLSSLLQNNTDYYWHVKELNGKDSSDWSETWKFTTETTSSKQIIESGGIKIYPNPATSYFNYEASDLVQFFSLSDLNGKILYTEMITSSKGKIDLSSCSPGVYFLSLNMLSGESKTLKLIIAR